jgi:hypothetical protein
MMNHFPLRLRRSSLFKIIFNVIFANFFSSVFFNLFLSQVTFHPPTKKFHIHVTLNCFSLFVIIKLCFFYIDALTNIKNIQCGHSRKSNLRAILLKKIISGANLCSTQHIPRSNRKERKTSQSRLGTQTHTIC